MTDAPTDGLDENTRATKRSVGRPSAYDPAFCEVGHRLACEGATDVEMADACGVHVSTYYRWKADHDEFREATRLGKESADDRVEASLFHRAVGYTHDAVKLFMPAGASSPVVAPYREHYPPETAAASLWLRNRRPATWRDKTEQQLSGGVRVMTHEDALAELE